MLYYLNQLLNITVEICNQNFTLELFVMLGRYLLNQINCSYEIQIIKLIIDFREPIRNFGLDFCFSM